MYGRKKSYWRWGELKTSHAIPHVPSQFHNNLLLLSVIKVSSEWWDFDSYLNMYLTWNLSGFVLFSVRPHCVFLFVCLFLFFFPLWSELPWRQLLHCRPTCSRRNSFAVFNDWTQNMKPALEVHGLKRFTTFWGPKQLSSPGFRKVQCPDVLMSNLLKETGLALPAALPGMDIYNFHFSGENTDVDVYPAVAAQLACSRTGVESSYSGSSFLQIALHMIAFTRLVQADIFLSPSIFPKKIMAYIP